jgi:hypothetical protein
MKKLLSILFSIAFLLVFVSFLLPNTTFAHGADPCNTTISDNYGTGHPAGGFCNSSKTELWMCNYTLSSPYNNKVGTGLVHSMQHAIARLMPMLTILAQATA